MYEAITISARQRFQSSLIMACKLNPDDYFQRIDLQSLTLLFGYGDTPAWQKYVIDLDAPDTDCFDHENALYRHTPRIFVIKGDTPNYYMEKLGQRILVRRDFSDEITAADAFAKEQSIVVHYQAPNDVCIIEENDRLKVKFKRFYLD